MKQCKYEYVGIELGLVSTKKFLGLRVQNAEDVAHAHGARHTTDAARPSVEAKALRDACANGIEVAIAMLDDPWHKTLLTIKVECSRSLQYVFE